MKTFLPMTAVALFAACTGSMLMSAPSDEAAVSPDTVAHAYYDLGTVRVAADSSNHYTPAERPLLADLGKVTVYPHYSEFQPAARLADLGTVVVRASESLAQAETPLIATAALVR